MEGTEHQGSPLNTALAHLKQRQIDAAYASLGITPTEMAQEEFIQRMMALDQGVALFANGQHTQAIEPLKAALPLVEVAGDAEARVVIPALAHFSEGIAKLIQGNAHRAAELLKMTSEEFQRLCFFMPGMEKTLLSMQAAGEVASARMALNAADLSGAEQAFGRVRGYHKQMVAQLDSNDPEDLPYYFEISASQVEFAVLMMRVDLEALDFDGLDRHLAASREAHKQLGLMLPNLQNSPFLAVGEFLFRLYDIFRIYAQIGRQVLLQRQPFDKQTLGDLSNADQLLFEAREQANLAGERGKSFYYLLRQLDRLKTNMLKAGKLQPRDYGRSSGLVALAALLIQVLVVHLTIQPTGFTAVMFFLGEAIIALIVGFGYEALRFKPLLSLYANVASSVRKSG